MSGFVLLNDSLGGHSGLELSREWTAEYVLRDVNWVNLSEMIIQ